MTSIPDSWFVASLRFTAFGNSLPPAAAAWDLLFSTPPDEIASRKGEGSEVASGEPGSRWRMTVGRRTTRMDIVQEAVLPPHANFATFRTLDSFQTVLDVFLVHGRKILSAPSVDITRFALGGILKERADSIATLNARARTLLPGFRIDDTTRDLIVRVNRPALVHRVAVNRVGTWSIAHEEVFELTPGGIQKLPSQPALRLELDVNTDADRNQPFPPHELGALLESIHAAFVQMAMKGDVL